MNKYDAQTAAYSTYLAGISTGNKPLEHVARDLYNQIYDSNRLNIALSGDVSDLVDPIDEDSLYSCIVFAAALTAPLPLPDTAKYFKEVQYVLRNDADELRNVRTVLCGRKPVQPRGRNADSNPKPRHPYHKYGTPRNAERWRKLPILAGCGRG